MTTHERLQRARAEIWANGILDNVHEYADLTQPTGLKKESIKIIGTALATILALAIS